MNSVVSFTHVLNPFPARVGSPHAVASRVTWMSLRVAYEAAVKQGIAVTCRAVVLRGDESAIEAPASETAYLTRTVQDIASLSPKRPLPLIADILAVGSLKASTSHIIFSNMDIAVQPYFYGELYAFIIDKVGLETPFTVSRVNINADFADKPLDEMYAASGPVGQGYDCFVIPADMLGALDLGGCCIGAPHFDNLLVMELDLLAPEGIKSMGAERLTFHLGNDIAWAAMIDYVEHNLTQSLAAISRMRQRYLVPDGSLFDRVDKRHFRRNASLASSMLRKVRRIPGLALLILKAKRALGRQF